MTHSILLAAVIAAGPSQQIPPFELDITVETAELGSNDLSATAPSTTVIGSAEIRASGLDNVADLLRRAAGVDVGRAGTLGKATTIRLDGASAAQTLVLLDGTELNSPTLGTADLSDLTLDDVDRIEIVRGPLSALYGSQAMGGVVNIITRHDLGRPRLRAALEAGAFGLMRGNLGSSGAFSEHLSYTVGVARTTLDGRTFDADTGPLDNDRYENTTLTGGLSVTFDNRSTLDSSVRFSDAERELPIEVFGTQVFDRNSSQSDRQLTLATEFRTRIRERVEPFVRVGRTDAKQEFRDPLDPGEVGPFAADYAATIDTSLTELRTGVDISIDPRDRLTVGVEWERRSGSNRDTFSGSTPSFDDSIDTLSLFAHNRLHLGSAFTDGDALTLTAGLRLDDVDGFGSTINPRLSGLWTAPGSAVRLRFGAGRGFRAPSLNEVLFPFFGNPDLDPEVARNFELAIGTRAAAGRVDAELRVFRTDYDDLITTDPDTFTAINLAKARVTGAELELRARPTSAMWLRGSYTYQDAEDRADGGELLRRPRHKGAFTVAWDRPNRYRLAVDLLLKGAQRDSNVVGFPERTPGWVRVDVAAGWTVPGVSQVLELFGRIENVLDEDYEESTAFPAPGVNGRAGIRVRF